MLDYVIFAVTFVIFLIIAVIYLYPGSKKLTTIPGPEPVDPLEGNIPDITACESLHNFLSKIHQDYGSIASFWYGPKMCVSVASPKFLEEQSAVFDRPYDIYKGLSLLLGEENVVMANGADGRRRHALLSKCFTQSSVSRKFSIFGQLAKQLVERWSSCPKDEYIPVMSHMQEFAVKALLLTDFGLGEVSDGLVKNIKASFDVCWNDTEKFLIGDWMESGSPREKRFSQHKENLEKVIRDAMKHRKQSGPVAEGDRLLIDAVLDLNVPEPTKLSDLLTVLLLGFHKTAIVMTWSVYFLASDKAVQDKLRTETQKFFGKTRDVTSSDLEKLKYLQQVLKESIRLGTVMPYTARVQDFETILDGHKIPAGTPIVQALGVIMNDEAVFANPDSFDPDRFNEEDENVPAPFAFEPFGFAGKRRCPGSELALSACSILLAHLLGAFDLDLAPDQVAVHEYGFLTKPKDEVWITASAPKSKE